MTKKQIIALLNKRAKLGHELLVACGKVDDYIRGHHLEDKVSDEDWLTGVEILGNPKASADRIIEIIKEEG